MWGTHLVGPDAPAGSSPEASQTCSRLCKWTVFSSEVDWHLRRFHLAHVRSSFVLALLPEHAARFQRAEIIVWSSGAWWRAEPAAWSFLRRTACLSGLQRVPSWFSSVQSVITVAGWLHYSMCISQHSQCFPCVVSFLLYSDSPKLCALQKRLKTLRHWFDTWFSVSTDLSVSDL